MSQMRRMSSLGGSAANSRASLAPQRQSMENMEGLTGLAAIWWSRANPERIRRMSRH